MGDGQNLVTAGEIVAAPCIGGMDEVTMPRSRTLVEMVSFENQNKNAGRGIMIAKTRKNLSRELQDNPSVPQATRTRLRKSRIHIPGYLPDSIDQALWKGV
jgi:hypothetical protein